MRALVAGEIGPWAMAELGLRYHRYRLVDKAGRGGTARSAAGPDVGAPGAGAGIVARGPVFRLIRVEVSAVKRERALGRASAPTVDRGVSSEFEKKKTRRADSS
jgi:hypothetical protein